MSYIYLMNIFSVRFSSLKHILPFIFLSKEAFHNIFIISVISIFNGEVKIENEKLRMKNPR